MPPIPQTIAKGVTYSISAHTNNTHMEIQKALKCHVWSKYYILRYTHVLKRESWGWFEVGSCKIQYMFDRRMWDFLRIKNSPKTTASWSVIMSAAMDFNSWIFFSSEVRNFGWRGTSLNWCFLQQIITKKHMVLVFLCFFPHDLIQ